jgi:sporulation protein YlmC with PRC-barrel domain
LRAKSLFGKKVIDSMGDDLGKVDDLEVNWETKTIEALVIEGDPEIKQKFLESKYSKSLFSRIGVKAEKDILIPVSDIKAVGDVITLLTDIQ